MNTILKETKKTLEEMTIKYVPRKSSLKANMIKTGFGITGIIILHYIPGPQIVVDQLVGVYAGIKAYQSARDYFSR